jgi:hypothetical protein
MFFLLQDVMEKLCKACGKNVMEGMAVKAAESG